MDRISAQEAKDRLVELIKAATENGLQFCITSDLGNIVVLPEETYENILVTLELLSTPGLMEHIKFDGTFNPEDKIEQIPQASSN
jgi:antitoxin YefM